MSDARQVVEIRVAGEVGGYALSLFDGFEHVVEPVSTTMRGQIADEHELAELCRRIRDAGLELVSLRRLLPEEEGAEGEGVEDEGAGDA